jgi:hypothetical protein
MPIPNTTTATSHAVAIQVQSLTIGMIQNWSPSQTRTITPVYELNPDGTGEILENVPGNVGGTTIQVNRYDLFASRMEQAWGTNFDIKEMLSNQTDPLSIKEKWSPPGASTVIYVYEGCWFSSIGRTLSVQGDRIVNVSAILSYTKKRRLL